MGNFESYFERRKCAKIVLQFDKVWLRINYDRSIPYRHHSMHEFSSSLTTIKSISGFLQSDISAGSFMMLLSLHKQKLSSASFLGDLVFYMQKV